MAYLTSETYPYWFDCGPDRFEEYLDSQLSRCRASRHLTKEEFLNFFPMFDNTPEEWIEMLITQCRTAAFSPQIWRGWLKWGEALFIAHYLSLREQLFAPWEEMSSEGDAWLAGAVTSSVSDFTAGSVRWSKNASVMDAITVQPLMATNFGKEFLSLRKRLAVGLVTVT